MSFTSTRSSVSGAAPTGEHEAQWNYVAVGLGAAVFFYLHLFRFPFVPIWRAGDQAIFLDHAARMIQGEVIYRDMFQFNLPGTEYLYYFLFRCFGIHMWVEPLALLFTETAVTLLIYSLSRKVLRGAAAWLPAVAFLVICQRYSLDGSHHWYSTLLVLLATNLIARVRTPFALGCAGGLMALATIFTTNRGVFAALGVSAFFVWKFWPGRGAFKPIATLLTAFAIIVASAVSYLAILAGPRRLYDSIVVFPLRYFPASISNSPGVYFEDWRDFLPFGPHSVELAALWLAVNVAVPLVFLVLIARLFRRNATDHRSGEREETLALYAFAGIFAFLAVAGAPSTTRIYCAATFAYILLAAMLGEAGKRRVIGAALALCCAMGLVEMTVAATRPLRRFDSPRGTVAFLQSDDYDLIEWLARNAHPGDELFGGPDLNFVLDLKNPSKLSWVEPSAYTPPFQVAELVNSLEREHPRFVCLDPYPVRMGPDDNLQPLRDYLKANYHLEQVADATIYVNGTTSSSR